MKHLMHGLRILVVDGSHGRVLRNDGDALAPRLTVTRVYDQDNPPSHVQGTERPNRVNDSFGRRSAMEQTDYHQIAEDRFIHQIAADMDRDLAAGSYARAVLVAPPVALGTFRKAQSPAVEGAIVLTIGKDLTRHAIADVTTIVRAALEAT